MAKCNHTNCFTCPYDDCIESGIRESDRKEIRERNKRVKDNLTAFPVYRGKRLHKKQLR